MTPHFAQTAPKKAPFILDRNLSFHLTLAAGVSATLIAWGALLGWLFHIQVLESIFPGSPKMVPLTAIGIHAAGLKLILESVRTHSRASGLANAFLTASVLLIGMITLVGLSLPLPGGFGQLPSPLSGVTFLTLALSWFTLDQAPRSSQTLAFASMVLPLTALSGYAYQASGLHTAPSMISAQGMAFHSAIAFILVGLGTLTSRPNQGVIATTLKDTTDGLMLRRFWIAILSIPFMLVLTAIVGRQVHSGDLTLIFSILCGLIIVVFSAFAWTTARILQRAEWLREQTELNLRGYLETAYDAIFIVNSQGKIDFINRQVERGFGYEPGELLGKPIETLIPERQRSQHSNMREFYLRFPASRPMGAGLDLFLLHKNGREVPVDISLTPVETGDGLFVTAVVRDITERRRIERQQALVIQASRALAETLDVESTFGRIAELIVPEVGDWCLIFEKTDGDALELRACRHREPERESELRAYFRSTPVLGHLESDVSEVLRTGKSVLVPDYLAQGEEAGIWTRLHLSSYVISPMTFKGETVGAIIIANGPSARVFDELSARLVDDLARRFAIALNNAELFQQTNSAVAAREQVLAIVSHDLKNPLSSIMMNTSLLKQLLTTSQTPTKSLEKIGANLQRACDRMGRLIEDLLDFSKVQAGVLRISAKPTAISPLLKEIESLYQIQAATKAIHLNIDTASAVPDVYCDPPRLIQILSNLVGNALKFTPEGGRVKVEAWPDDGHIHFAVIDNGPGILPDHLPRVFDRFWQAEDSKQSGTGLGLSIAKGLVEAQGGKIWVESPAGGGCAFYFTLPTARPVARLGQPGLRTELPGVALQEPKTQA